MQPQMCPSWAVRQMSRNGKWTTGRNGIGLILRWSAKFLQSLFGHTVPGTDSLPVCDRPENGCVCREFSQISLSFAGFTRTNRVPGRFIRGACEICYTGFLFPHARTVVRNGSSGPCTKIMMSRTGRTRVWSLRTFYFRFTVGILRAFDGLCAP